MNENIFISHHSSRAELARHVARYLEKNGVSSWYAPRDIHSGEQWDESINEAIRHCKAVVLLFCAKADRSRQVKRELALADRYKKPVYWLRVEHVEPNNLSYFLTSTQWLDWMDMRDDTLEQLVRDLRFPEENSSGTPEKGENSSEARQDTGTSAMCNWAKGLFAFDSVRKAAECAARIYFQAAQMRPDSSVILPTGRSATMIFRAMLRIAGEYAECPFGEAHIISDTETFGVGGENESSRTKHIRDMLITPLKQKKKAPEEDKLHLLSGVYTDKDPIRDAQKTLRLYPPSVHAVSLSPTGEIIAYEVGTYNDIEDILYDGPRIVEVGEHSKKYIDPNQPSKSILTIGLGTALSSDILLILAFDMQKANILSRMFQGPVTAGIPATILRNHPNAYVITTGKIARAANVEDFAIMNQEPDEAAKWIISR